MIFISKSVDLHSRVCGALIPRAPFDHGRNPRANIAFHRR
jgi:hypothetical protein